VNGSWRAWKITIGIALGVLLALDGALAYVVWQNAREGPEMMRLQRDQLKTEAKLLEADIQRGEKIRGSLPQVGKDCRAFYEDRFLDATTGYSQIESDFDSIVAKAGLKTTGLSFRPKDMKDHGVTEITLQTAVEGDYSAILHFIDGLEQSHNFYLLNDLQLDSSNAGMIRLRLTLNTFVRTA
jgi:hypothetical protein